MEDDKKLPDPLGPKKSYYEKEVEKFKAGILKQKLPKHVRREKVKEFKETMDKLREAVKLQYLLTKDKIDEAVELKVKEIEEQVTTKRKEVGLA